MNLHTRKAIWTCWVSVIGLATSALGQLATTRPATSTRPALGPIAAGSQVGTVTGDNVYVRSGSDRNYYPVTKLNRGDQVTVVGEAFGWLKILPPAGLYSVIDKNYVDRVDDETGVLNGTAWVYAGSKLDRRRYAKQVKLRKGDRVQVIGETADGKCHKIVPPHGAHLWISGDYVSRGGTAARMPGPKPPEIEPVKPGELELTAPAPGREGTEIGPLPSPRPLSGGPGAQKKEHDLMIGVIEAEITAESAKPIADQAFGPIIEKLRPMAKQTEDEVARLYAEARVQQIQNYLDVVAAVQGMRKLREKSALAADALRREREKIKMKAAVPLDDIVVRGQIRVSGIYDGSGNRPKRWRIVEPGSSPARTLAYIELPDGSPIDPVQYYGRYVGIRASARHIVRGLVRPVPLYIVEEIKVLAPPTPSKPPPGSGVSASPSPPTVVPSPPTVAAPGSQPAGS